MPKYRSSKNGETAETAPNAWDNAEPYYFGNQMPPKDIFKPLPENGTICQEGQLNGFSENVPLDGYKHNGNSLSYIERGTFPKAGNNQKINLWGGTWSEGGTTDYKIYLENGSLIVTGNGITQKYSAISFSSIGIVPSRIGILLVGGGGGSGGFTWYDPDKNGKKSDQYIVSGSSGGGGGLLWGVLHLDGTSSSNYFKVTVGNGGEAGSNANRDGLKKKNPKYGGNGTNGVDTTLYWKDEKIASARGGRAGSRGNFQTAAAGGEGGSYKHEKTCAKFTYLDGQKGGKGCDCTTDPVPSAPAWSVTIKFAQTDDSSYITRISHEAVPAVLQGGTNHDARAHKVPGGASYDIGSTSVDGAGGDDTTQDFNTTVYGRGGAGGDWEEINERGAPGCFVLFY